MTRVAVLGPGRAGTAVALAAADAGYDMDAVAGRSEVTLSRFLALVPGAMAMPVTEAVQSADLVVVAVPDGTVEELVRELAVADVVHPGSRWIHLAGSLGLDVLEPVRLAGAQIAACHPAQTLSDPEAGRAALDGCAWAVTATEASRPWARRLVRDLGGTPFDVANTDRALYHTAMSLGANAVGAVVTLARELLLGIRVTEPEAFLTPLGVAAVQGAAQAGAATLTGPVRRGDAETVATHLRELAAVMPEMLDVYRELARLALVQARRSGLDAAVAEAVAHALDSTPP